MDADALVATLSLHLAGGGSFNSTNELLRSPDSAKALLELAARFLDALPIGYRPNVPPLLLLAVTLLARAVRRCPLETAPEARSVLSVLSTAARRLGNIGPVCTQLALGAAMLILRSPDWSPQVIISSLGHELANDRHALCSVLTLMAEELHAPTAKMSVAPKRLDSVREALQLEAAAVLSGLDNWAACSTAASAGFDGDSSRQDHAVGEDLTHALRCGLAWCNAGFVHADIVATCDLLCSRSAQVLRRAAVDEPRSPAVQHATDALRSALCLLEGDCLSRYVGRLRAEIEPIPLCPAKADIACAACTSLFRTCPCLELREFWLPLLLEGATSLPFADASSARACWVELNDIARDGDESSATASVYNISELASFRLPLLHGVLHGPGAFPPDFALLSAEDRDAIIDAREDCRALLRGAIFVDPGSIDTCLDALNAHACAMASSAAEALQIFPCVDMRAALSLEASLHAMSAAGKPLGQAPCSSLAKIVQHLLPVAANIAGQMISCGRAEGRALLCTILIFIGSISSWLVHQPECVNVAAPLLLESFKVPEDDPHSLYPLRSKMEHAGCVGMMKLTASIPGLVLQAVPFETLLDALHSSCRAGETIGLSTRSADLLLCSMRQIVAHAARATEPFPAAHSKHLASCLLAPVVQEVTDGTAAGAMDEETVARACFRLSLLLAEVPQNLQADAISIVCPLAPSLASLVSCVDERVADASCSSIAAVCRGCGKHAASLLRTFANATQSCRPHHLVQLTEAIAQCATQASDHALCALASSLWVRLAESTVTSAQGAGALDTEELQSLIAQLFDSVASFESFQDVQEHSHAYISILLPALPSIFTTMFLVASTEPSSVAAAGSQHVVMALKRALVLLRAAVPSAPLGTAMFGIMGKPFNGVQYAGAAIFAAILRGLASWYPSWLLSDVVAALWALRESHRPTFLEWLQVALSIADVPRKGLGDEQKAAYVQQVALDGISQAGFKAGLKHLCGGKKKGTPGERPPSKYTTK
jgi:hypothetical protein